MSGPIVLAPESIEALAAALAPQVAELLRDTTGAQRRYVDADTLAETLGLAVDTVYRRATDLGGVKILTGPGGKARWRFDVDRALASTNPAPADPPAARRRRPAVRRDVDLLPINGDPA